jgi:DNA-binding XRE family transcriptional regulator
LVEIERLLEGKLGHNAIKEIREGLLMSRAELARKAGVSLSTIHRVEKGENCREETKRRLILALGYDLSEKDKVFPKGNDG